MEFNVNPELLKHAHTLIRHRKNIYWLVGGAGSGKSTICKELAGQYGFVIYDLDAHIYGDYHGRFSATRHPVNSAWAAASNQLAWLLDLSWQEFNKFNQAALAEYTDLMAEDLSKIDLTQATLIDGGICNPALATKVIPTKQIICLANRSQNSQGSLGRICRTLRHERLSSPALLIPKPPGKKFLDFRRPHHQIQFYKKQKRLIFPFIPGKRVNQSQMLVNGVAKLLNLQPS